MLKEHSLVNCMNFILNDAYQDAINWLLFTISAASLQSNKFKHVDFSLKKKKEIK